MIASVIRARFSELVNNPETALHEAARIGDDELMKHLLTKSEYLQLTNAKNSMGCTPLRLAAAGGYYHCMETLLAHDALVDMSDVKAARPLLMAVQNNHVDCVELLLLHGADPEGDMENMTAPLYIAASMGYYQVAKLLIEYGADLTFKQMSRYINQKFSQTPLHAAIMTHNYDCLRLMLESGSDPNFLEAQEEVDMCSVPSLYHTCVRRQCDPIFATLIYEFGANLFVRDERGLFAWQYDYKPGCEGCIPLLNQLKETPRSLKSHCRLVINTSIKSPKQENIRTLVLPRYLLDYLNHKDLEQYDCSCVFCCKKKIRNY